MTDTIPLPSDSDQRQQFLTLLEGHLDQDTFVKLILGKYRGQEPELKRIVIRKLTVKGQRRLSFVYSYTTRDVTKNASFGASVETIDDLLGASFKSAHLFSLTEDVQIEFSKKGKCRLSSSKASCNAVPSGKHDREKERFLDPEQPFLTALGVTDKEHRILPSMSRKWKQINKFLEVFQRAFTSSGLVKATHVDVVDFGSGKGYLTFAIHEYLRNTLKVDAHVTGIELRQDLVRFCAQAAEKCGSDNLSFRQGDVSSYAPEAIDILIALHACDTATDLAIHMGICSGAEIIMCAPCCHKEIRPQLCPPPILQPMHQFGIHIGQEAEMVTDSLRALLLEAHGYKAQIFEFVSLEHTSKNKMLLAVKHSNAIDRDDILAKIEELKSFYGIQEQCLETLLNTDDTRSEPRDARDD